MTWKNSTNYLPKPKASFLHRQSTTAESAHKSKQLWIEHARSLAADKNFFKGKIGMGITVGGDRAGGQELAQWQIHTFYLINGMIPVGGGPFGANLGATIGAKIRLKASSWMRKVHVASKRP